MGICVNGLQSSVGGFFSAQGKPARSIMISTARQVVFLPPLIVLLPRRFGMDGLLWAGPAADAAMAAIALSLLAKRYGELRQMEQERMKKENKQSAR